MRKRIGINSKPFMTTEYELYNKHGILKNRIVSQDPILEPDTVTINVLTKDGIIKESRVQPFKSFLANFTRLVNMGWMQIPNNIAGTTSNKIIEHVTGGATSLTTDAFMADVKEATLAPAAPNLYGIMVGDMDNTTGLGLTQESGIGNILHYNDWMLRTLLLNDGGAPNTDLEHRVTNLSMPDDNTLVISRRFQNDSAADIYVDECGLIGVTNGTEYVLLARDILNQTQDPAYVTVATTEILEISYTFSVVSGIDNILTSNWLKYLSSILGGAAPVSPMKDIVNSAQLGADPSGAQTDQDMTAAQDDDTHGIVVSGYLSSGSPGLPGTLPSTSSYKVNSKLLDSEIDYGPMVAIAIDLQSSYSQFGMYRDFENDNSTTAFIDQSGLYMKDATLTKYFMMVLSNVSGGGYITVLPDEILRVKKYMKFNL